MVFCDFVVGSIRLRSREGGNVDLPLVGQQYFRSPISEAVILDKSSHSLDPILFNELMWTTDQGEKIYLLTRAIVDKFSQTSNISKPFDSSVNHIFYVFLRLSSLSIRPIPFLQEICQIRVGYPTLTIIIIFCF